MEPYIREIESKREEKGEPLFIPNIPLYLLLNSYNSKHHLI